MSLFAASRKTLSLAAFLSAGTLSPFVLCAETAERASYDVSTESDLRKYLSEKSFLPAGGEAGKDETYWNNSDLALTGDLCVDTLLDESVDGTGTIEVLATDVKIFGGGNVVSSSELELSASGSGDLFFLNGTALSAENVTFAGTTDEAKKTGRVFTTINSTALSSSISLGAGTTIENRRLVADAYTNYRAQGGALISAHILDTVYFASSESGDVVFRGNAAVGGLVSYENSAGESVSEDLNAYGGAVYAVGLVKISGAGTTLFSGNTAYSENQTAAGGAVFIANATLTADGELGSTSYPGSFTNGDTGSLELGLQLAGTTVGFSGNSAEGANAFGGALVVYAGWFDAADAEISFSGNVARNHVPADDASDAAESSVSAGAFCVSAGGRATFDKETHLVFYENSALGNSALTTAFGGAAVVSEATFFSAGTASFEKNRVEVSEGGSVAFGGALFIAGTIESETDSTTGEITETHSTNVALAGTLSFSENCAAAHALAAESSDDGTVESLARGGALAVCGGNIDGASLASLTFSGNCAASKTTAQGGALAVWEETSSNVTEMTLKTSGEFLFSGNSAKLLALDSEEAQTDGVTASAQGGALFQSAGTLELAAAGTLKFSGNSADASAQANVLAQGGALFQSAGTLTLAAAEFSENSAESAAGTAQGGAAYFSDGSAEFSSSAKFSGNAANALTAQGGAVYASGGSRIFGGAANFSKNAANAGTESSAAGTAIARGGAIYTASGALEFSSTAHFSENSASAISSEGEADDGRLNIATGGAVHVAGGTLTFGGAADFSANTATSSAGGAAQGGAVYLSSGTLDAGALEFSGNAANALTAQGGAVYVSAAGLLNAGTLAFSGDSVSSDAGTASGGALYSAGAVRVSGTLSAKSAAASGATAASGGAVAVRGGRVSVSGDGEHEISGNAATASGDGGNAFGGAIFSTGTFASTAGTLKLSNNAATASGADGNAFGGAIYMRGGSVSLADATLSGNAATASGDGGNAYGGAVYIDASSSSASTLTLSGNTTISGNAVSASSGTASGSGIFIGVGAGTEANGAVAIVFDAGADVSTNEDGETVVENAETATVSDAVVSENVAWTLKKTGAGNLILSGEISFSGKGATLEIDGGNALISAVAAGTNVDFESVSVASGATLNVSGELGGFAQAKIAGTLAVSDGGAMNFSDASAMTLSGTLSISDASAKVAGTATVDGAGTVFVSGNSEIGFDGADATLTLSGATLSVGAGTLTLSGGGKLEVAGTLEFTGDATITLADGATLALAEVAHSADVEAKIDGAGTLMLYGEAADGGKISFSKFYETATDEDGNETKTLRAGTFTVGENVKIAAGISIGEGVSLSLSVDSQVEGSRNIRLAGGTLLAPDSGEDNPFLLESLSVISADVVSALGAAGENQVFKMAETTETDEDGSETTSVNSMSLSGKIEITETTTFIGDVVFAGTSSETELSGAGTLVGSVSGTGTVSLAEIRGNLEISDAAGNARGMWISGAVNVSGNVNVGTESIKNSILRLNAGASLSAGTLNNFGTVHALGDSSFSGNFVNAGTLVVAADSTFTLVSGTYAGTAGSKIDISASNSAVSFSEGVDARGLELGVVIVDASAMTPDDALGIFGLTEEQYASLTLKDANGYSLEDRFEYDSATGTLVFLGLNGEAFAGTLYGDFQRESVNRTHGFMRAAQFRGNVRPIAPQLYGEYKLDSPYMRAFLEKRRQRGGEVSAQEEAKHRGDLALAKKLNSANVNFWIQGDFSYSKQRERHGFDSYEATVYGALAGASVPLGENWELGLALCGDEEEYKTVSAATRHKIRTDAYGISGYGRFRGEWFDWSLGAAGMFTSSDSERGDYSGDFDAWRLGAMTEIGATLRAQSWLALRAFAGLSTAYSHVGSFSESGGDGSLSVDSDGAFGVRTSIGASSAFLLSDAFQFRIYAAWLFDLGNDEYSLDAYMPSKHTRYVIRSRENETSALEAGATINWTLSESLEVFGGYAGTIRAGERAHAATLGVNFFF